PPLSRTPEARGRHGTWQKAPPGNPPSATGGAGDGAPAVAGAGPDDRRLAWQADPPYPPVSARRRYGHPRPPYRGPDDRESRPAGGNREPRRRGRQRRSRGRGQIRARRLHDRPGRAFTRDQPEPLLQAQLRPG